MLDVILVGHGVELHGDIVTRFSVRLLGLLLLLLLLLDDLVLVHRNRSVVDTSTGILLTSPDLD